MSTQGKDYFMFRVTGICSTKDINGRPFTAEQAAELLKKQLSSFGVNTIFIEPTNTNWFNGGDPVVEVAGPLEAEISSLVDSGYEAEEVVCR